MSDVLPQKQRFKRGSTGVPFVGKVTDSAGDAVDLSAQSNVRVKARRTTSPSSAAAILPHSLTGNPGEFSVDVSSLELGRYFIELEFTDGLGKVHQPPENTTDPGVEIEVYGDVG